MPRNRSGRPDALAISVTERLDVLVAENRRRLAYIIEHFKYAGLDRHVLGDRLDYEIPVRKLFQRQRAFQPCHGCGAHGFVHATFFNISIEIRPDPLQPGFQKLRVGLGCQNIVAAHRGNNRYSVTDRSQSGNSDFLDRHLVLRKD